jgi:Tfp pilus assembly protein PilN
MTPFKQPGKQPDNDPPSKPSLPTLTIGETTLNSLPMLTEVAAGADAQLHRALSAEEKQQFLHQLEARIETLFTQKLGLHLAQLQRQAIDQALDELKAKLPELLHDALNEFLEAR